MKRELAEAQKLLDIAHLCHYDMPTLFQHDLMPSSYLFDSNGLMAKPEKTELTCELENKYLNQEDFTEPQVHEVNTGHT